VSGALRAHRTPLLVESDAPRLVQARNELVGALRRAAIAAGPDALRAWLQSQSGRDDFAGLPDFLRAAPAGDPRRPVAAGRVRAARPLERGGLTRRAPATPSRALSALARGRA
jgi:hypothetical protein